MARAIVGKRVVSLFCHFALLRQFVWRHARLHPLIALLNIASIALGVAVYLAVQVANHSATRAFEASIDLVSGKSQLELYPTSGPLDDVFFHDVNSHPSVAAATPILEAYATLSDHPGEYLRILGIDVFTNAPFQTLSPGDVAGVESAATDKATVFKWLASPGQLLITDRFAERHRLSVGSPLMVQINGASTALEIAAIRPVSELDEATSDRFALMDIGWLQELTGRSSELDSIQIILEEGHSIDAARSSLGEALPPDIVVTTPVQRSGQVETMLRGFRLNLTALSMVSILVGVFLIYNTVAASVVRRRTEIGTLRATGASRGLVRGLFLEEAALYACLGALVGVPAGILLSRFLVTQVSSVISVHYLLVHVARAFADPLHVIQAIAYGVAAALAGAWIPSGEAASLDPANALRPASGAQQAAAWRWRTPAGLASLVACAAIAWGALHGLPPGWTFVSCFLLMVGFSLLVPSAIRLFARPPRARHAWESRACPRRGQPHPLAAPQLDDRSSSYGFDRYDGWGHHHGPVFS